MRHPYRAPIAIHRDGAPSAGVSRCHLDRSRPNPPPMASHALATRLLGIGFVSHVPLSGEAAPRDNGPCPPAPVSPSLALFGAFGPPVSAGLPEIGFVSHACLFLPPQITNHKSSIARSASDHAVPLPLLRVARIGPEFCARVRPRNHVTSCAARSKEFRARGVFYLFNCCTDGARQAGGSRRGPEDRERKTEDRRGESRVAHPDPGGRTGNRELLTGSSYST